ncbi:MAG: 4Fe-4S ferredoxin N-terminal domain-containing protein, partial [Nitriliruptoraceae bacterium]
MTDESQDTANEQGPWEARARDVLEGSSYDVDLAARVARDAQRVVAGELSGEEFGRRYHDAYLDEFGLDERPDAPRPDLSFDEDGASQRPRILSRREALSAVGGAAVGILFLAEFYRSGILRGSTGAGAVPARTATSRSTQVQNGMVIDLERS